MWRFKANDLGTGFSYIFLEKMCLKVKRVKVLASTILTEPKLIFKILIFKMFSIPSSDSSVYACLRVGD